MKQAKSLHAWVLKDVCGGISFFQLQGNDINQA